MAKCFLVDFETKPMKGPSAFIKCTRCDWLIPTIPEDEFIRYMEYLENLEDFEPEPMLEPYSSFICERCGWVIPPIPDDELIILTCTCGSLEFRRVGDPFCQEVAAGCARCRPVKETTH